MGWIWLLGWRESMSVVRSRGRLVEAISSCDPKVCYCRLIVSVEAWGGVDVFFFSSRRRHTRFDCDWSSDVCSSDLYGTILAALIVMFGIAWGGLMTASDRGVSGFKEVGFKGPAQPAVAAGGEKPRTEEGRGGEEGRSRGAPDH